MSHHPPGEVVQQLRAEDRFLIVGHIDADPDSIGSVLALRRLLVALNKTCLAVTPTPPPTNLDFLPDREYLITPDQVRVDAWRHLVVVDCGLERTGAVAAWADRAQSIINIDHHATNSGTGSYNWIDASYAATTEMVAALREPLGVPTDSATATLLYAGLVGDTGTFRFSNTTPAVFRLAAELREIGVDVETINSNLYEGYSLQYLRLLALVLQTIQMDASGRVVHAHITETMRRSAGATPDESEGFVQYLRLLRDPEVAVLFSENESGQVRVQLRSDATVDVSAIAGRLGGGGHERAAGVKLMGGLKVVQERVLNEIAAALRA